MRTATSSKAIVPGQTCSTGLCWKRYGLGASKKRIATRAMHEGVRQQEQHQQQHSTMHLYHGHTLPHGQIVPSEFVSTHPDAVRRRQEFEQMRVRREQERSKARAMETAGVKWWEGSMPSNMSIIHTEQEFQANLQAAKGKLLIVKFFTEDCYVCKTMYPKLKRIAADNPDVTFAKMNGTSEKLRPLFERLGITKVPYFHFYRDGVVVSQLSASLNPEKLAIFRAEIAAHKSSNFATADNAAYTQFEA